MKAIAYRRVSTDEQVASGNGLDAQADALDAAIAGRGWELVDTYTDEGRSGGNFAGRLCSMPSTASTVAKPTC